MNTRQLKLVAVLACSAALPAALHAADIARSASLDIAVIEAPEADDVRTSRCHADVDGDQAISFSDVLAVLVAWGTCPHESNAAYGESGAIEIVGCPEDLDRDDAVDFRDLTAVLVDYGRECGRHPEVDPEPEP